MDIPTQSGLLLVLVLVLGVSCTSTAEVSPVVHRRISSTADVATRERDISAAVGFKLYCVAPTGGSLVFSPYSIAAGLSMLLLGSRGESAVELGTALGLSGSAVGLDTHESIGQLSALPPSEIFKVNSAHNLFLSESRAVLPSFSGVAQRAYGVSPVLMDFRINPQKSRTDINSWVTQKTGGKIRDLLPQGSISEATQMIFVNAVYFAAKWASEFDGSSTYETEFTKDNGEKMMVDMMGRTGLYRHGSIKELDAKVLEVPYSHRQYSMYFLVPYEGSSLQALHSKFCTLSNDVHQLLRFSYSKMRESVLEVRLPKFTLDSEIPLSSMLSSIGVNSIFDPNRSDLSGIDGTRDLFVSDALHKTRIEVDESGTTAAAASGFRVSFRSLPQRFIADKPFMFLIMDRENGVIIFMGHILEPHT